MSNERNASPNSTSPQENAMFLDILHEAPLFGQRKPRSIFGAVFYCFILAGYAILAASAPCIFQPIENLVLPLLCSCSVVLLIVTGILLGAICICLGYLLLDLYHPWGHFSTLSCLSSPEDTFIGTAAMMLVMVWKPYISILSTSATLRFVEEILILFPIIVILSALRNVYLSKCYIHQYNSLDSQPDVLKSLYSPLQPSSPLEDLRYHDGGRLSDQKMALLQYQRENLHFLSEEILRLQECLSKYEGSNDGSTPQMNQLQSELRLARSLMAESDAEVQRVQTTNNQSVEENERLRAILGEWSIRAAKLERAFEVERMSNLELQKKISTLRNPAHTSAASSEQRGA